MKIDNELARKMISSVASTQLAFLFFYFVVHGSRVMKWDLLVQNAR